MSPQLVSPEGSGTTSTSTGASAHSLQALLATGTGLLHTTTSSTTMARQQICDAYLVILIAIVLADFDPEYQPNFYNYDRNFDSQYEHPDFPNNRHQRGSFKNLSNTMLKTCIYIGAFSPPERPKRRNLPTYTSDTIDNPYDAM